MSFAFQDVLSSDIYDVATDSRRRIQSQVEIFLETHNVTITRICYNRRLEYISVDPNSLCSLNTNKASQSELGE